ncbi:MAG TPA: hypothetical protein P5250_02625 [Bacteroidales bacterium]|nr:hypothetical protein [Bacteroidales bacterium]
MIKTKLITLLTCLTLFSIKPIYSQEIKANAKLEKSAILVGQQTKLTLECTLPTKAFLNWPILADTLTDGVEIINISKIDTAINNNFLYLKRSITITSFDSGNYIIPPLQFSFSLSQNDTNLNVLKTLPLQLNVTYIDGVDTTKAIKDIKAPLDSPFTWREILPWGLGIIILIILALTVIYVINRIRKKKPIISFSNEKLLPPHEQALQELETLRQKKLWEQGKVKEYYSELTDILRIYISKRFEINATEMTSEEIYNNMKDKIEETDTINILYHILTLADIAKFAKGQPLPDENDLSMKNAINFIKTTIPITTNNNDIVKN